MPIVHSNVFTAKGFFKNKHFNTLFRYYTTKGKPKYKRIRIPTKDLDFIDLDISSCKAKKAIIAIHGLEGSSASSYIKSLSVYANKHNFDLIAVNLRGCSGENNKLLSTYHSGKTSDLAEVITNVSDWNRYQEINLVGYSLGGNIVLKFMGEFANKMPKIIKKAVAISVPCDLKGSAITMGSRSNRMYMKNFLKTLKKKVLEKQKQFPKTNLNITAILKATNFKEFDNYFTAPTNNFIDANDYWKRASSKPFLPKIKLPTLLITALDDPFLNTECYPFKEAENNTNFYLHTTKYGGHVGFCNSFQTKKNNWLETKIIHFLNQN